MTAAAVPSLPRGVRMHHDRVRNTQVLLGPERALMLDEIGAAVLSAIDGERSVADISGMLAARYIAPVEAVQEDVAEFLADLAAKRLVDMTDA